MFPPGLKNKCPFYTKKILEGEICLSKFVISEYFLFNKLHQQYLWAQMSFGETERQLKDRGNKILLIPPLYVTFHGVSGYSIHVLSSAFSKSFKIRRNHCWNSLRVFK